MKRIKQLTDNQFEILDLMCDDLFYPFKYFEDIGLTREEIRNELHILRDAGLVQYMNGLSDGDGMFAGSGYGRVCKAKDIINKLIKDKMVKRRQNGNNNS